MCLAIRIVNSPCSAGVLRKKENKWARWRSDYVKAAEVKSVRGLSADYVSRRAESGSDRLHHLTSCKVAFSIRAKGETLA